MNPSPFTDPAAFRAFMSQMGDKLGAASTTGANTLNNIYQTISNPDAWHRMMAEFQNAKNTFSNVAQSRQGGPTSGVPLGQNSSASPSLADLFNQIKNLR